MEVDKERSEKEEEIMDLGSSKDEFEVFNEAQSLEDSYGDLGDPSYTDEDLVSSSITSTVDMGIQRKSKKSLLELIESQPGKGAPSESSLSKLPPPPPKAPLPPVQPSLPRRVEPADPKGKERGRERRWWMLEDPTQPPRTSPSEWRSN